MSFLSPTVSKHCTEITVVTPTTQNHPPVDSLTLDWFCGRPIVLLVDSTPGKKWCSVACRKILISSPSKSALPVGYLDAHQTYSSLGPPVSTVHIRNGISIGSAIFAKLTVITDRQTDRSCMPLRLLQLTPSS